MANKAPPILLVHGAWHDASCWHLLSPLLQDLGHQVAYPDLPSHGSDTTPLHKVTLKRYLQAVQQALSELDSPALVVGHSMAGMVIAALAEAQPSLIDRLVFLNAYLPCDGDSIFSLMGLLAENTDSVQQDMLLSEDKRSYSLQDGSLEQRFYNLSPAASYQATPARNPLQASLPLAAKTKLSDENFGNVSKAYIYGTEDRVIPLQLQRAMLKRQRCDEAIQLETDHSPFYSAPEQLAQILHAMT